MAATIEVLNVEVPTTEVFAMGIVDDTLAYCSFSFNKFSNSVFIFFIYKFCSTIILNMFSFSFSNSPTSLVYGSSVVGIFRCSLHVKISKFFLLITSSASFTSLRSYPDLITRTYEHLIFLSFSRDNIFSKFNHDSIYLMKLATWKFPSLS